MATNETHQTRPLELDEVLTLAEAAAYLRVREKDLEQLVCEGKVVGQRIGEEWRFLKSVLYDWLRYGSSRPRDLSQWSPPWFFLYPSFEVLLAELEHRLLAKDSSREHPSGPPGSKQRVLEVAGRWKDDPTVDEMLAAIYERRGRPMTEGEE